MGDKSLKDDENIKNLLDYADQNVNLMREVREISNRIDRVQEEAKRDAKANKWLQIATLIIAMLSLLSTVVIGVIGLLS
jgi:CHASE3 domain sensor protein